jgi:hypothetical protein
VLGAGVIDHLSNLPNGVVDQIRRHAHAVPHLIEESVLALDLRIDVHRKLQNEEREANE